MDQINLSGLSTSEADARLAQWGPNQLPEKRGDLPLLIFIRQFNSPFIYMLLAAALISFGLDHTVNGVFIFAVLVLNATIGTVQEYSAQRAALALKRMVPQYATVIRDGVISKIDATRLVPDDIVMLVSGDKVPADVQLVECHDLLINESILTGESHAAVKTGDVVAEDAPLSERTDRAFAGTIVTHGRAKGKAIATGVHSQIGQIAEQVSSGEKIKPPLLQRIERFTLRVSYSILVIIALLFVLALLRGADLANVFLLSVALAVSAIPEGLPAAITIALAIGMRRMARVNVIVRKLVAVESLGSCTYIASDKTGTLTVNEMTVKKIVLAGGEVYDVSGEGMDMHGDIYDGDAIISSSGLEQLVRAGMLSNEASLTLRDSAWVASGDGVDLAFLVLAAKHGFDHQKADQIYPELGQIPYESEQAFSASANQVGGETLVHVKGSAERVLAMCRRNVDGEVLDRARIDRQVADLAGRGYRVLALAVGDYREHGGALETQLENLTFLGLAGMIDPLRPEAKAAVRQCREAKIDVAMITGDHPQTALALARELGIADADAPAVTGADVGRAVASGEREFSELVASTRVFARIEPTQKLQIVQRLIADGHNVAVTGDGVNDAPALRHAHVGVAMGKRGTDVARESSDLIITDDNFASIVQGIKQGRIVYNNIRKVVFLLISTGAAEITLFILSVMFGYPIPLFPIQLLWLNLVTNGIQDVALAFEPEEQDELRRAPRPPGERIFNRLMLERVIANALVMGSLAFVVFVWMLEQGATETAARNITLLLMVLFENVHVLNSRSETQSIFRQAFFGNPLLIAGMLSAQGIHIGAMYTPGIKDVLQIEPVTLQQWSTLLAIALVLIVVGETHKYVKQRARDVG